MAGPVRRIAFTMYPVRDMARARAFYEGPLGLVATHDFRGEWVEYDLPGGCFALTTMAEGVRPASDAGGSIAFEVDDVDALVTRLRGEGTRVALEPFSTPVCRMAVVIDPEGNAVTLHRVTDE
jgi:predicted enzyme related to lactoylglutathione lyase